MRVRELLEDNPIVAAVKNIDELQVALKSQLKIIFVLFGDITNIKNISESIAKKNKIGIVHIDLIDGIANREIAVKFLKENTSFHGIISTKQPLIKVAKSYGLIAIQRVFIFDTLSLNNAKKHLMNESDAIEILPGLIPKVIKSLSRYSNKPIVAGGLIETKEEVIEALNSGAASVSTTKKEIWES